MNGIFDYGLDLRSIYRFCNIIWQALKLFTDSMVDFLFYEVPLPGGRSSPMILFVFSTAMAVWLTSGIIRAILRG